MQRSRTLIGISLASVVSIGGAVEASAGDPRPASVPASGVGLGWGWQSAREAAMPSICVEFARGEDLAQTARLTIREVSDRAELMEELGISASAAVDAITVSVSASSSFAKSVDIKQTSSTFLLRAEIDDGLIFTAPPSAGGPLRAKPPEVVSGAPERAPQGVQSGRGSSLGGLFWENRPREEPAEPKPLDPVDSREVLPLETVRLTPHAEALAAAGEINAFLKECGDSFVWGIRGGAELNAAITFETRSLEDKTSVAAEMSGSYSFVRGTGKFTQGHNASEAAESYTLTSIQIGGSEGAIPGSREALLAKLDSLAKEAAQRPKPVGLLIASYHDLPNWPAGPLAGEPSARDQQLANYWRYTTLYEDIQNVLSKPQGYMLNRGVTLASLRTLQDQVNTIRRTIEQAAKVVQSVERQQGLAAEKGETSELETVLRGMIDQSDTAKEVSRPESSGPAARMTAEVARAESVMVPLEELLTRMPLPYADPNTRTEDGLTDSEMQRAIVDYYIARTAKRRCAIAASAPECLSNEEIEGFALQVPTGPKDLTRHGDPVGYGTGSRFGDVPLYRVLDGRLDGVKIYVNPFGMSGIDFTYKTPDGRLITVGTGLPKGSSTKSLTLEEGETVSRIDGLWLPVSSRTMDARHMSELTFTTSTGRKLTHSGLAAKEANLRKASKGFTFESADSEEVFALVGRLHGVRIGTGTSPVFTALGALEPVYRKRPE